MAGFLTGHKYYDLVWASETLARFESVHGASSQVVRELCGLSRNDVVRLVSGDQIRWRAFKKAAKHNTKFECAREQLTRLCHDIVKTG